MIPKRVHFVFGLARQTEPFHLVHYLCLASCLATQKPDAIYFYYHYAPYGAYWERLREQLVCVKIPLNWRGSIPTSFISNLRARFTNTCGRAEGFARCSKDWTRTMSASSVFICGRICGGRAGGALVFVPDDGGQVEIIGGAPRLLYASPDDAVEKITRVLDDADAQRALCAQLAARAELFRVEHFTQELRALMQEALCERAPSPLPR
jgi:hypothetical protein